MDLVTNIKVINLLNNKQIKIEWDILLGATSYKIYRSAIPYGTFEEIGDTTSLSYIDTPSIIPFNEYYYKIAGFDGINIGPVSQYGVTFINYQVFDNDPFSQPNYPNNSEMKYYFEEIRRRNLWMLENDGENMKLLKRRYEGTRCPHIEEGAEQCPFPLKDPKCYGTNFVGGYYESLDVKIRRINTDQLLKLQNVGFRVDMSPRMWTIWSPKINTGDIIIDSLNQRWEVNNSHVYLWRGLITHQDFDVVLKMPRDIIYRIPV